MLLFRVRGVPVRVGWSWLLILLLVFWSLAAALFPARLPGLAGSTYLVMAAVTTVLFFASVLVHELSHTLRSLREGVPVREITLWLFGGISRADEPLPGPAVEFRVVAAGPASSAVLALAFWGVAAAGEGAGAPEAWVAVPDYLARLNGLLLAFNLVPALPLDGGRLLHALLWWRSGDTAAATVYASVAGRVFAALLVAIGLVSLIVGNDLSGLWLVLLGWFLLEAVRQEVLGARVMQAFAGLRVRDLMSSHLVTVEPGITIAEFADFLGRRPSHPAYPVLDRGRLVGLLLLDDAGRVPERRRPAVRVAEVMLTGEAVPMLGSEDLVVDAVGTLNRPPGRAVVRDRDGGVVGLLSATDLSRSLEVTPLRRRSGRSRTAALIAAAAALLVVVVATAVYHPPVVVLAPGPSFDVRGDIEVRGVPVQRPTGPYLLTSVQVSHPSALGLLVEAFRAHRELLPLSAVLPAGLSAEEVARFERRAFTDSQQAAAVAAATAAGYPASLTGAGARVLAVVPYSSAAGVLEVGDTIVAAEGTQVDTAADLARVVAARPAGQEVTLTVRRSGDLLRRAVSTEPPGELSYGSGLGALVVTADLEADLPFAVRFRDRPRVGGPSAGLAYALALGDMLDPADTAAGRAVAASGTVTADGRVGPVGGLDEKGVAAAEAGADLLLVPRHEVSSVAGVQLEVVGVVSLDQALAVLGRP